MGFRFVFGRAGSGKSRLCLDEIRSELRERPWGKPLILLVPEQSTHQMEVALACTPDLGGSLRAQVLSFQRLGWRVFSETGGGQNILIGATGKRMLLRRILLKHRLQLKAFAHSATRPGMADLLAQAIGEFKTYRISSDDLRQVKHTSGILADKLQDLILIYEEFQGALGQGLQDPDDELPALAEKISSTDFLKEALVWVDGFTGFTPQELEVLSQIMLTAQEIVLTLPLDPQLNSEDQLFAKPWKTYQDLLRIITENAVYLHPSTVLKNLWRFKNPWLGHLETYYSIYPTVPYKERDFESEAAPFLGCGIQILAAANRRAEVENIARELRNLARDKGLSWNAMAVLTRDLASYHELISQVFTSWEIPFFLDYKRSILHHPLIELVQSIFEVAISNYAYEPLFRCLKTDFFPLSRDAVDRLENYVLEHGIHGDGWSSDTQWHYHRQWTIGQKEEQLSSELKLQAELKASRRTIYGLMREFVQGVKPPNKLPEDQKDETGFLTVREITEKLYTFLEELEVPARLKEWSLKAQAKGELSEARLHAQIWEAVIQVLDEMVSGLGDELLNLEDYTLILASGIEGIELGLIPPGLDQVLIGSLDRSRNPETRVLFLLGANEGILPARPIADGVLDAEDREELADKGVALAPKGKAQMHEEQFFIYIALTRAREKLLVSYSLTDEEGRGLTASPVVTRLAAVFPQLCQDFRGNQRGIEDIGSTFSALQAYAEQLGALRLGKPLSPFWQAVEKWFLLNPLYHNSIKRLQSGLERENQEEKIPRPLARRLYGKRLKTSISRLEQFVKCPFSHYARYGLKLRERPIYQLSSPDMGEFFHALLRDFAFELQERGLAWGKLTKEESWALVDELTNKLVPSLQHNILQSNARYRYITHKLKRTVHHAVRVLAEHARQGIFFPIQLEVGFGPNQLLPGVEIPLSEDDSLLLCGQIDRVDAAFLEGQVYLRILDYKSRELSLSLDSIYYGLNLQLLTYLNIALQGAEILLNPSASKALAQEETAAGADNLSPEKIPAGFLYFPVLEPQLEEKILLSPEELEQRRLKAVKVSGYLLANPKVLQAMDAAFSTGQSDLLGLKLKKDGSFTKGANVLTEEQFSLLSGYLRQWFQKTGEEILNGNISLFPYRRGKSTGCQYCIFKAVCHFDPYLPENRYRDLPVLKQEEIWQRLENSEDPPLKPGVNVVDSSEAEGSRNRAFNWLEITEKGGKQG